MQSGQRVPDYMKTQLCNSFGSMVRLVYGEREFVPVDNHGESRFHLLGRKKRDGHDTQHYRNKKSLQIHLMMSIIEGGAPYQGEGWSISISSVSPGWA